MRQPVVVDGRIAGTQSIFFGKMGLDGKPYAPYGPLAAVMALPHHLAGRALARVAGVPREAGGSGPSWPTLVGGITTLSGATGAALAVAGFYVAAVALATPAAWALSLSLLLGGATILWPYGTTLYSEAWLAAGFVWATALLLEARRGGPGARPRIIGAAACLAVAGLVKVTGLILAPALVLAVLCERSVSPRVRREAAVALTLGILLAAAVHIAWNQYRFGAPFDFGYDWSETIPVGPPRAFLWTDVPRGLVVLLMSPGKSLFLWAPVLLLGVLNAPRFWRRERAVACGIGAALVTGLLFYAAYLFPEGGYAHGPRHLVPLVPVVLLAACGAEARRWPRAALLACGAVGVTMALLAVSVSFLEDQALGRPAPAGGAYYEQIDPAPGRPSNRYHLAHLPFLTAIQSPGWLRSTGVGQGPDFFALHLRQAGRQFPDGGAIPPWLPWAWSGAWLSLLALSGWALSRARPREP